MFSDAIRLSRDLPTALGYKSFEGGLERSSLGVRAAPAAAAVGRGGRLAGDVDVLVLVEDEPQVQLGDVVVDGGREGHEDEAEEEVDWKKMTKDGGERK